MPRSASIVSMSLADLTRVIRKRQREVEKLARKRSKVQRKLDEVERRIFTLTGSVRRGARRSGPGSRPRNEMSLADAIAQVLSGGAGPMNVGAIAQKVQAGGYRSGSANFRGIVNQTLIKERKRFKNTGRGMYEVTGGAGTGSARVRTRKRKRKAGKPSAPPANATGGAEG